MIGKPFSEDAACGMLVGLAVGDALGVGVAGRERGSFSPVSDIEGGGPLDLTPGSWGEATSMALCLAQMLRSANGWDAEDAMRRFRNWRDHGYLSATRVCFGMDEETAIALRRFARDGTPYAARDGGAAQEGNAGIMRLAPIALAYGARVESAVAVAQLQSRLTHGGAICERAAAALAEVLVSADRSRLPRPDAPPEHAGRDVRQTLHAAFWAVGQSHDFRSSVLRAVNLGGDASRVAAVTGQIAGRLYGYGAIPRAWRAQLFDHDKIVRAAEDLYALRPIDA